MEVHHHAHTSRKKWTHYFWEFLMLFLAVFCGFLAENFREHQVEKNRSKQYILSFYEDLRSDTTRLNAVIEYNDDKIAALKDMELCFDTISTRPLSTDCIERLIIHSKANRPFYITDRTTTQLINAGGFRIINKNDADSIVSYITKFKDYYDFQATIFQSSQDNVRNTLTEFASFKSVNTILQTPGSSYGTTTSAIKPEMKLHGPLFLSADRTLLNKWFNQLSIYLRITKRQRDQIVDLKNKAAGLIEYLKKKYDLK